MDAEQKRRYERIVDESQQVDIEEGSDDQDDLGDLEDNDQEDEIDDLGLQYELMNEQLRQ